MVLLPTSWVQLAFGGLNHPSLPVQLLWITCLIRWTYSQKIHKHLICTCHIWITFVIVVLVQLAATWSFEQKYVQAKPHCWTITNIITWIFSIAGAGLCCPAQDIQSDLHKKNSSIVYNWLGFFTHSFFTHGLFTHHQLGIPQEHQHWSGEGQQCHHRHPEAAEHLCKWSKDYLDKYLQLTMFAINNKVSTLWADLMKQCCCSP